MLKGISPLISPDLLRVLHQMGHGDQLTLADAHFPGHSLGPQVVRADGLQIAPLLAAILHLLHLEEKGDAMIMMQVDPEHTDDPQIEADYTQAVARAQPGVAAPVRFARSAFYRAASTGFVTIMTGDTRPYGNLILTKGVTPAAKPE